MTGVDYVEYFTRLEKLAEQEAHAEFNEEVRELRARIDDLCEAGAISPRILKLIEADVAREGRDPGTFEELKPDDGWTYHTDGTSSRVIHSHTIDRKEK